MTARVRRRFRALVAALGLAAGSLVHAGSYTDLFVFGDSLSDRGNTSASTLGFQPGSGYADGRFSNGPTYAERLSDGLGIGVLTRSGAGGDNFAFGGAETNGPGGFVGLFLNSLVEQVDDFLDRLNGSPADPDALYTVFIGANDLFGGQSSPAIPVGVIETQIGRLVGAGARTLLGVNLPRLGLTPEYRSNGGDIPTATIDARTLDFNARLGAAYDAIQAATPGVTVHRVDVESLFDDLVANPTQWGFTNTAEEGIAISGGTLDAPGYVFWDNVHPTREAHALLGEATIRAVLPEGDYDRSGTLAASDYAAWASGYGATFNAALGATTGLAADGNGDGRVDAADYTIWRDAIVPAQAVPEPTGIALAALLAAAAFLDQHRGGGGEVS